MAVNLATKYEKKVSERFYRESLVAAATNNEYNFDGVRTVTVYSFATVPLSDYNRTFSGNTRTANQAFAFSRYGSPADLQDTVQSFTVTQDKSFTFVIDKGDKKQRMNLEDAGRALSREMNEVVIPAYDTYVLKKLFDAAPTANRLSGVTSSNAYAKFLEGQELLGNNNVPDTGRVCFCSYGYFNKLRLDSTFTLQSDAAYNKLSSGDIGEVDGCHLIRVPSNRLPANTEFILCYGRAVIAPRILNDYKIHDNPPGLSGWLVEGRVLYDAFVDANKAVGVVRCVTSST